MMTRRCADGSSHAVSLSAAVWSLVIVVLGGLASAVLGCSGAFDFGDDDADCGIDSVEGRYATAVIDERESDIGSFGLNGVASAAAAIGPFEITSEVRIEGDGRARFEERWVQRNNAQVVEFEATGVVRITCVGDTLSNYVIDWGPTRVRATSYENGGFLGAFRVGNVAVEAGPDSSVVIREDDVSGDRVVTLDVVGPGPMGDGVAYRLR